MAPSGGCVGVGGYAHCRRQVERDRRVAERVAIADGGSDDWTSKRFERLEAGYTYEYTFTSVNDRLTVTENSP